jgi:GT2 family glycosyltransferase
MKIIEKEFGNQNPKPIISVIIVAYKTNLELKDCLKSLDNQVYKNFETIVVDNDSEDIKLLEQFSMRYFKLDKNYGPSYARNLGVEKARGMLLAFLDDDATTDINWTKNIFNTFSDKSIVAVRGKIIPKTEDSVYNLLPTNYDLGTSILESPLTTEGNCAVRKKDFLEIGGFNPKLYGHEGLELSYKLIKNGKQLYIPDVVIYHDSGDSLKHFLKKQYRHGYIDMFFYKKYPEVINYKKQFKFPKIKNDKSNLSVKKIFQVIATRILSIGAYQTGLMLYRINIILLKNYESDHI